MKKHIAAGISSILALSGAVSFVVWAGHTAKVLIEGGASPSEAALSSGLVAFALLTAVANLMLVCVYWTEYHHPR